MKNQELDWIVKKASELLSDKVRENPLKEEDINLAFELFAKTRLRRISNSFKNKEEYTKAVNYVQVKLNEISQKLNEKNWPKE